MPRRSLFPYLAQQAWLLSSFAFTTPFLLGAILLALQVEQLWLWITAGTFCVLSPFLALIAACTSPIQVSQDSSTSLIRYADTAAAFEARTGMAMLVAFAIAMAALFAWGIAAEIAIVSHAMRAVMALGTAIAIALLLWREFSLVRYFAAGRKANIDQRRLEVWYEAALAQQRRALRSTLQHVAFQNYCPVRNGICSKTLAYQGPKSSFAAYSFQPPVIDRVVELRDHLHKRGHTVLLPTDDSLAQVLVCKLCQTILSCQHLIAEATEPNSNVYFEYGLAHGHGKKSWLIAIGDLSPDHPLRHPVLRDTIAVHRQQFSAEAVAAEIDRDALSLGHKAQLLTDRVIPVEQFHLLPDRSLTNVVVIGPHNQNTPPVHREPYAMMASAILETLAAQGLNIADPFAATTQHTAGHALDTLASARAVIALLADDNTLGHANVNALTCFLVGYALAKERPLLVFQNLPAQKTMIDLAGIIRRVADLDQFRRDWRDLYGKVLFPTAPTQTQPPLG